MRDQRRHRHLAGFTIIELLTVTSIAGLLALITITSVQSLESPLTNDSANITHFFRLVRARAIAQTRSIRVTATDGRMFRAESARSCAAETFEPEADLTLELDDEVTLQSTDWEVCFNQRGLAVDYVNFVIRSDRAAKTVEVALGGGVRIQ